MKHLLRKMVWAGIKGIKQWLHRAVHRQAPPKPPGEDWIDSRQVMEYLGISRATFFRLKKAGIITGRKVGRREYFFRSELEKAFTLRLHKGKI